jgi:hypothetical protein
MSIVSWDLCQKSENSDNHETKVAEAWEFKAELDDTRALLDGLRETPPARALVSRGRAQTVNDSMLLPRYSRSSYTPWVKKYMPLETSSTMYTFSPGPKILWEQASAHIKAIKSLAGSDE